jgi:hypothetical protein
MNLRKRQWPRYQRINLLLFEDCTKLEFIMSHGAGHFHSVKQQGKTRQFRLPFVGAAKTGCPIMAPQKRLIPSGWNSEPFECAMATYGWKNETGARHMLSPDLSSGQGQRLTKQAAALCPSAR